MREILMNAYAYVNGYITINVGIYILYTLLSMHVFIFIYKINT